MRAGGAGRAVGRGGRTVKTLACVFALLVSSVACAGTITLGAQTCTRTQICFNVPNNARVDVDYISDATQYGRLLISINGGIYDSGIYAHPHLSAFTIYNAVGTPLSGSLSIMNHWSELRPNSIATQPSLSRS
jgi:hypothetical protein